MSLYKFKIALIAALTSTGLAANFDPSAGGSIDPESIDILNSQDLYWEKINKIEGAKSKALQLQAENKNLIRSLENKPEPESPPLPIKDENKESAISLQDFLKLSLMEQKIEKAEQAAQQEAIIEESGRTPDPVIETLGKLDSRGALIKSEPSKPNRKDVEQRNSTAELTEALRTDRKEFMKELSTYFDNKMALLESKQAKALVSEAEATPDSNGESNNTKGAPQASTPPTESANNAGGETSFKVEPKLTDEIFLKPIGKIVSVTPRGVKVMLAYQWDGEDDSAFASAIITEKSETVSFFPMARYERKYKVKSFSAEKIILIDSSDEEIQITK